MKKTLVSLAAASLIVTSAVAADKGIDIVTTGQAVVYYETSAGNGTTNEELFDQGNSQANVGVQLNLDADLKNNFTFGSQLSYLGTAGLEKNLVNGTRQSVTTTGAMSDISDEIALTKIFIAKKIGNSTVKIGRQELPKSLSPFAFSEGWNVFKNTFEAILAVNTDIPDTTIVGAYVGQSNNSLGTNFGSFSNLTPVLQGGGDLANVAVDDTAYMLTVQNKSIPMTTITASYYDVAQVNADTNSTLADRATETGGANAIWIDAKVAGKDLPMGLSLGLQGGQLSSDLAGIATTTAFGAKIAMKSGAFSGHLVYNSVDGDDNKMNIAMKNFGTGVKTPLYSQMIYNQNAIALDADTICVKGVYNTGDYGKIIAQYASTAAGKSNLQGSEINYAELDVIYKVKTAGVQYFAAYINRSFDKSGSVLAVTDSDATSENVVRVWARVNF